jgi:tRNA A-37 threonylcarbamoyl transferase component Bud32
MRELTSSQFVPSRINNPTDDSLTSNEVQQQLLSPANQELAEEERLVSTYSYNLRSFLKEAFILATPLLAMIVFYKLLAPILVVTVLILGISIPLTRRFLPSYFSLIQRLGQRRRRHSKLLAATETGLTWLKPFVLWGTFLCAPGAVLMMAAHSIGKLLKVEQDRPRHLCTVDELRLVNPPIIPAANAPGASQKDFACGAPLVLQQNLPLHPSLESNFLSSPAFTLTAALTFGLGLPGILAGTIYDFTQVDRILGCPSLHPEVFRLGLTYFYLYGLSSCLTTLFFKAYFTYPLNFISCERTVTIDSCGVRKSAIKGWFKQAFLFSDPTCWDAELKWDEVRDIRFERRGIGGLSNLPTQWMPKTSSLYKALNRFARLTDAFADKLQPATYLVLSDKGRSDKNMPKQLAINLWELNDEEKVSLYLSICNLAPHAVLDQSVRANLLGTQTFQTRYDHLLAQALDQAEFKPDVEKAGQLPAGATLNKGRLRVKNCLMHDLRANVYSGEDASGKRCIIKEFVLVKSNFASAEMVQSAADWQNELAILSEINHPKIPQLQQAFIEDNRAYLVIERMDGKTLRQIVKEQGRLDQSVVVGLAIEMCRHLSFLHSLPTPVVHRDFSPDCLLLGQDNVLRLVDFGLASFLGTRDSEFRGRKAYTAPELFHGDLKIQNDFYSMGATLYFLLTGIDPNPISELHPSEAGVDIVSSLDAFIAKATSIDASTRHEDATWMELELRHILGELLDAAPELPLSA